jgi:hypothetical protein
MKHLNPNLLRPIGEKARIQITSGIIGSHFDAISKALPSIVQSAVAPADLLPEEVEYVTASIWAQLFAVTGMCLKQSGCNPDAFPVPPQLNALAEKTGIELDIILKQLYGKSN